MWSQTKLRGSPSTLGEKLGGFPKLRGFQKKHAECPRCEVFTQKVKSFSLDAKICPHTKLRGIQKKWRQCPKTRSIHTKVQRFSSDAKMWSQKKLPSSLRGKIRRFSKVERYSQIIQRLFRDFLDEIYQK